MKIHVVVCLALMLLLSTVVNGCFLPSIVSGVEITRFEGGFLVKRPSLRNFPAVLGVQGTPYEMGYQHGYLMKDYIIDHYSAKLTALYAKRGGWEPDGVTIPTPEQLQAGREMAFSEYYTVFDEIVQDKMPQLYQEALGIAAGLQARYKSEGEECPVLLDDVLYLNFIGHNSSQGCSNFAAWGEATKDGETIHAQNSDYYNGYNTHKDISVMIARPNEGNEFLLIFWPGMVTGMGGMNTQGITSSSLMSNSGNILSSPQIRLGLTRRLALQYRDNIKGVFEGLRQFEGATSIISSGNNVLVVDGIGDGAPNGAVIELSANETEIRYQDPGFLSDVIWATNHFNCYPGWQGYEGHNMVKGQMDYWGIDWGDADTIDEWQSVMEQLNSPGFSWSRYERYRKLISENYGDIDVFTAMKFQRDSTILYYQGLSCNNPVEVLAPECLQMFGIERPIIRQMLFSVFSVVYCPSDGIAWIAVGGRPAQIGTYWPVNLNQYLEALDDHSFYTTIPDSDRDNMADDWELAYKLNPNNPADAMIDTDGDGVINLDEYNNGTDPTSQVEYEDAPDCE